MDTKVMRGAIGGKCGCEYCCRPGLTQLSPSKKSKKGKKPNAEASS